MARRRGERDRGKERFWREMVGRWRRSGVTIRAFCAEHGLSEPSFYGWRREIARRDEPIGERSARTGARSVRQAKGLPAFVPLRVTPPESAATLEVVVGAGHIVRVAPGFDAATLRHLLAVLAEAPAC
jgi:transposase-like protein